MSRPSPNVPMFPSFDSIEAALWPGVALIVFIVTAILVDVIVILAARFRLVDLPNQRSAHALPTARGGGVAIVVTTALASVTAAARWPQIAGQVMLGVVLPAVLIAVVGIVDDIRPTRATVRLVIQAGVALLMTAVLGPVRAIAVPGLPAWETGWLAWPLTIVWIVGMINAFNFMDGADGMAGLAAVVAGVAVALLGYESRSLAAMLLAAFMAAAVAGFLVFNWEPARVFMGDVGSGFLGCFLAALPLIFRAPTRDVVIVPVVMALWPSIYDPLLSVIRRLWNGENPLHPHREFLFHRLIRSGVSHTRAALLYGALAALGGSLGLLILSPLVPIWLRAMAPLAVMALALGLTWSVEHRCSRVLLVPGGSAATPAADR